MQQFNHMYMNEQDNNNYNERMNASRINAEIEKLKKNKLESEQLPYIIGEFEKLSDILGSVDVEVAESLDTALKQSLADGSLLKIDLVNNINLAGTKKTELENVIATADITTYSTRGEINSSIVNVKDKTFNAKGNANYYNNGNFYIDASFSQLANDDTVSFLNALTLANLTKSTLIIPEGNYFIQPDAQLSIKCPVICLGTIMTLNKGSNSTFVIERDKPYTTINGSEIATLLTSGLTAIPELSNYEGCQLVLTSSEWLIHRNITPAEDYYKNETTRVLNGGLLEKPLTNTYANNSNVVLNLINKDVALNIQLKIKLYGNVDPNGREIVRNLRTDVTFTIDLENVSNSLAKTGIASTWNCDIKFKNCRISGFVMSGLGYGVSLSLCYNTKFENCNIYDCRHAITGRHNVDTFVNGGQYSSNTNSVIDDHWGNNLTVINANLMSNDSIIGFAGNGVVTVENCNIIMNCAVLFVRRSDTPYINGKIRLVNSNVNYNFSGAFLLYKIASNTYNFGIDLVNPDIEIKNVTVNRNGISTGYMNIIGSDAITAGNKKDILPKNITIENLNFVNCPMKIYLISLGLIDNVFVGDINISVKNLKSDKSVTNTSSDNYAKFYISLSLNSASTISPINKLSLDIDNMDNMYLSGDALPIIDSVIKNSKVVGIYPPSAGSYVAGNLYDSTPNKIIKFINCLIDIPSVAKLLSNFDFSLCYFIKCNLSALGGTNTGALTINSVQGCTFDSGSISAGYINNMLVNRYGKTSLDIARIIGYRSNAGSPIGSLTPQYIGEEVFDSTNLKWYKSVGTSNTNWVALN